MKNLGGWLRQMIEKELAVQVEGKLKRLSLPTDGTKLTNIDFLYKNCKYMLLPISTYHNTFNENWINSTLVQKIAS
jgi:hypothetical protein